ncbi:uncharacterized protein LOC143301828 isoform X3 [Babylonia areolata]|uniref:uncharacterized protein LOC143301828 isoform X3 n=1 Tax=Babylonia areolata TaxID=304850 RepID=UPI003FD05836
METVKCGRKQNAESEPDDSDDLMQKAFQSLPHDHPFWENVLPYLSTWDNISLRNVNRNCQDVVDSYFSTALTLTVPSDMPSREVRIVVGNNTHVRTLTAQRCRAVDDIVPFFKYQDRLVSVDLSYSVFTSVENAVDTLVNYCRLLVKISLRGLSNYSYPLAARSVSWPFVGLLRNPLPHLQHLDLTRNGSGGLSPAMFTSLLEKHPRRLSNGCEDGSAPLQPEIYVARWWLKANRYKLSNKNMIGIILKNFDRSREEATLPSSSVDVTTLHILRVVGKG